MREKIKAKSMVGAINENIYEAILCNLGRISSKYRCLIVMRGVLVIVRVCACEGEKMHATTLEQKPLRIYAR
jgi:hypothetical protein